MNLKSTYDSKTRESLIRMLNGGDKLPNTTVLQALHHADPIVAEIARRICERFGIQVIDVSTTDSPS